MSPGLKSSAANSKITPPGLRHVLIRNRLIEHLSCNRDKKLVLILGQAAQGKTTLAASYVGASPTPWAWINLGPEESSAAGLFRLLVHSLQWTVSGVDLSSILSFPSADGVEEGAPLYRMWVSALFESLPDPMQVVLDGLDRINPDGSSNRLLQLLIEEAPSDTRLIMISREMPPLDIDALKMRWEASVLTNEDLAFTLEETDQFVKDRGFSHAPDMLALIHELTEGWIGGIVLLCDYVERMPGSYGESQLRDLTAELKGEIFRYLNNNIFAALPAPTQDFLLKSSILDIVESDSTRELTGVGNIGDALEDLVRRNLFVQSIHDGEKGYQYRYHPLFRDFLQTKARATLGIDERSALHLKAGALFEQRGDLEDAVEHYLRAKAYPQAASVIEGAGVDLLRQGKLEDLARWLKSLPRDLIPQNPWLLFYLCATNRFKSGKDQVINLHLALTLFRERKDVRGSLLSLAYLLDAPVFSASLPLSVDALLIQTHELLNEPAADAYPYEKATLWFQLGLVATPSQGNPREGYWACENAYLLARELGDVPLQLNALVYAFTNLSFLGESSLAEEVHDKIEKLLTNHACPAEFLARHYAFSAQGWILLGKYEKADSLVRKAMEKSEAHGLTHIYILSLFCDQLLKTYLLQHAEAEDVGYRSVKLASSFGNLFMHGLSLFVLGISYYFRAEHGKAVELLDNARRILAADEARGLLELHMLDVLRGTLASHVEGSGEAEENLDQAVAHFTTIVAPLLSKEAHLAMALLRWRQGRIKDVETHLRSGFKISAEYNFFRYLFLSRDDLVNLCILALELDLREVMDYVETLLVSQLSSYAMSPLEKLFHHENRGIAQRAKHLARAVHRARLPRLRLKTLGEFRASHESSIEWEGSQPQILLKAIIAHGSGGIHRDRLIADIWPEAFPKTGERNFRINLHRLRKSLEPAMNKEFGSSYVHMKSSRIYLDPELCLVDMDEFLSILKDAEKRDEEGDFKEALRLYGKAAALYGGDFLGDEVVTERAEIRQEELRGKYIETLHRMASLHEKRGASSKAISYYKMIVQAEPAFEEAVQRLMILYDSRGMRGAAIKAYEELRKNLESELNVDPDAVTTAIYRKVAGR